MKISDAQQLACLDAVIASLRRRIMPVARECDFLADQLGVVRDRVASAKLAAERAQAKAMADKINARRG